MTAVTHLMKEVYAYRELLFALTYRDIRVKYKQAAMGMLWAIFMPMLAIASGVMFRFAMAYFSGRALHPQDVAGVMVKSLPWVLFAGIVGGASNSLVGNMGLITKIYFPREIVPLSTLISSLFDFCISLTGVIILMLVWGAVAGRPPIVFSAALLWVPVLLLILVVMAAGFGLFLSCANLFLRDVKYIVQVLLQFGVFFSLVFLKYDELGRWGAWFLLNPVAPILEGLRSVAVRGHMDPNLWPFLLYSTEVALFVFFVACSIFDRAEYLFAEYV
jgi:ABC-type polysaccharide/polyol phosphate export permease